MKTFNLLSIITSIFLLAIMCSCKYGKVKAPDVLIAVDDSCGTNPLYSQKVNPIITNACALSGCHVTSGYKDFSSYQALKSEIDTKGVAYFLSRMSPGGGMPPSYSAGPKTISTCDYTKIKIWLEAGYPNN